MLSQHVHETTKTNSVCITVCTTHTRTSSPVQSTVCSTVKGSEVITKLKESGKVGGSSLSTTPQQRGPTGLVHALHQIWMGEGAERRKRGGRGRWRGRGRGGGRGEGGEGFQEVEQNTQENDKDNGLLDGWMVYMDHCITGAT